MDIQKIFSDLPEGFRLGGEEDVSLITLTIAQAFADSAYPIPSVSIDYSAHFKFMYEISEGIVRNTIRHGAALTNEDFSAVMLIVPLSKSADYGIEKIYANLRDNAGVEAAENMRLIFEAIGKAEATLALSENTLYVEQFAVQPPRQGQKLGSMLMRELFRRCEPDKCDVFLYTNTAHNESIYHHFGFETISKLEEKELGSDTYFLLRKAQ